MSEKNIELNIDLSKDVYIENISGNVIVSFSDKNEIEYSYEKFGNIEPEVFLKTDEKNKIIIKNSDITKTNAIITLSNNIPNLEICVNKGNIIIGDCKIPLVLSVTKGNINLINCSNKVNLSNLGGDIKIDSLDGAASIKASGGSVKVNNWLNSSGQIETDNGQILIKLFSISNTLDIKSKYGKIVLGIEKDAEYDIIARGKDVINYLDKSTGDNMGSPSQIKNGENAKRINLFTANNKVLITTNSDIERVSPDIEKIFSNLDVELSKELKNLSIKLEKFEKKVVKESKSFFDKMFNKNKEEKKDVKKEKLSPPSSKQNSSKMEIINMLKEGKISPEEAERLLNALK